MHGAIRPCLDPPAPPRDDPANRHGRKPAVQMPWLHLADGLPRHRGSSGEGGGAGTDTPPGCSREKPLGVKKPLA